MHVTRRYPRYVSITAAGMLRSRPVARWLLASLVSNIARPNAALNSTCAMKPFFGRYELRLEVANYDPLTSSVYYS